MCNLILEFEDGLLKVEMRAQPNSTSHHSQPNPSLPTPRIGKHSLIGNLGTSTGHLQIVPLYNLLQSFDVFSPVLGLI